MTVHYKMDKSHPDYAEYIAKRDELLKEHIKKWDAIEEEYKGKGGKATERPVALENRRFCKEVAELAKSYDYLYTIQLTEEEERIREEYINGGTTHGKR